MSLTDYVRAAGRHRGKTPAQLRTDLLAAEKSNDSLVCQVVALATEVDELKRQFDAAAVDYSGALEDKRAAEETAESLAGELATAGDEIRRLRAALANARPVTVPAGIRPVDDPEDIATQPIPAGDHWLYDPAAWKAPTGEHRVVPLQERGAA